ncbi:hypothetical protein [Marinifilum sp. D714]|uniref:hypothetical protein n=1 Tax=Marinifilum sp. D714 TaxID=2937523 RepID=UPI0027C0F7A7|nr:hypothetical protein [Marinifilum sp. D714]MDQ2178863.1 hypothetical protein [Marinifilum sp. D714]
MKNKSLSTLMIVLLTSNFLMAQHVYHSHDRPKTSDNLEFSDKKEKHRTSDLEVGFHYGPAWTSGETKNFASKGSSFSMNLGANNGLFYFGTELSVTHWKDHNSTQESKDLNFNETNFLWLIHTRIFLGEGKVQPYLGMGTDLLSFGEYLITNEEDDDDYYSRYEDEPKNYNAWVVPNFGVRWKMGEEITGNVGFSADLSQNYSYVRLQLGLVF